MSVTKSVGQATHSLPLKVAESINVPEWRHGDRGQTMGAAGVEDRKSERRLKAEGKKFATAEFARGEIISGPPSVDMDWRDRVGGRNDGGGHDQRDYFARLTGS